MGLAEKRAMKEAQEGWLPKRNDELKQISGGEIAYDIDWDSFDSDAKGIQWLEHNGPQQVAMAFRVICQDALGKEAIQSTVKSVRLRNAPGEQRAVEFSDGVLSVQGAFAEGAKGTVRDKEIRATLEGAL